MKKKIECSNMKKEWNKQERGWIVSYIFMKELNEGLEK